MRKSVILITTILLGMLVFSGIGKYIRSKPIRHNMNAVEVHPKWWNTIATLEMLGVIGLIVGLFWPPVAVLTGVCLVLYFGGAVMAHLKAGDANVIPSGTGAILAGILAITTKRNRHR